MRALFSTIFYFAVQKIPAWMHSQAGIFFIMIPLVSYHHFWKSKSHEN